METFKNFVQANTALSVVLAVSAIILGLYFYAAYKSFRFSILKMFAFRFPILKKSGDEKRELTWKERKKIAVSIGIVALVAVVLNAAVLGLVGLWHLITMHLYPPLSLSLKSCFTLQQGLASLLIFIFFLVFVDLWRTEKQEFLWRTEKQEFKQAVAKKTTGNAEMIQGGEPWKH